MSSDKKSKSGPTPVTYATLINNKIAILSPSTPYFAVEQHFFYDIMEEVTSRIRVDSDWYLETYPDIKEAIKVGAVPSAKYHFQRFGYYEHRMPYKIVVDEAWYLEAYPDIRSGIDSGDFASAQDHFEILGYKEGRLPHANFNLAVVEG